LKNSFFRHIKSFVLILFEAFLGVLFLLGLLFEKLFNAGFFELLPLFHQVVV
jgi:hypothetical protein